MSWTLSSHLLTHELKNIAFINAHTHTHTHTHTHIHAHHRLNTTILFSVCTISHRQSADTLNMGFWLMQGMFLLLRKRVCVRERARVCVCVCMMVCVCVYVCEGETE